jgi:hypothetical protein
MNEIGIVAIVAGAIGLIALGGYALKSNAKPQSSIELTRQQYTQPYTRPNADEYFGGSRRKKNKSSKNKKR